MSLKASLEQVKKDAEYITLKRIREYQEQQELKMSEDKKAEVVAEMAKAVNKKATSSAEKDK